MGESTVERRHGLLAQLPALLILLVALSAAATRPVGDFGVETDFYGIYAPRAERLFHGEVTLREYGVVGPFYELALLPSFLLRVDPFLWARLLAAAASAATILAWWRIARKLVPPVAAAMVPWLLLLSPVFVRHTYLAATDALYLALFSGAVLAVLVAEDRRGAAAAGALALAATLTRYSGIVLVAWGLLRLLRRHGGRSMALAYLSVLVATPAVVVSAAVVAGIAIPAPEFLYNVDYALGEQAGDWDAYLGRPADQKSWEVFARFDGSTAARLLARLPDHAERLARGALGPALLVLGLVGIVPAAQGDRGRGAVPGDHGRPDAGKDPGAASGRRRFLLFGAVLAIPLVFVQPSERYALPLVPWFAVTAACATNALLAAARNRTRAALLAATSLLVATGAAYNAVSQVEYRRNLPAYLPRFAHAARLAEGDVQNVLARKPHLPYLLDASWSYFPDAGDLATLKDHLAARRVDHVLYATSEYALRPAFRFLAYPPYRPEGWEIVHHEPNAGVLYRVTPSFFTVDLAPDDAALRGLMNAAVSAQDPFPDTRRLARYLAETGRHRFALAEFRRLEAHVRLDDEERMLMDACRAAITGGSGDE